jgi:hypothetical protein
MSGCSSVQDSSTRGHVLVSMQHDKLTCVLAALAACGRCTTKACGCTTYLQPEWRNSLESILMTAGRNSQQRLP